MLYDTLTPAVAYLSGIVLFVAGLSIVRLHNRWTWSWIVLLTLTGWIALCAGAFRMTFPALHAANADNTGTGATVALIAGALIGLFLTFKGYRPRGSADGQA